LADLEGLQVVADNIEIGMSQDFRLRPDSSKATPSWENKTPEAAPLFSNGQAGKPETKNQPPKSITEVAQTLAANGGGALSVDLAFDLVLNDLVDRARESTGANGAAIALLRDGNLVCRATAGDNAPDLGVRVETGSGLTAACLNSARIQLCRDTDTDARVNAEACRRLGVRSMLLVPLIEREQVFGILQVFSSWPNAFGERENSRLEALAERIAENKREVESGTILTATVEDQPAVASWSAEPIGNDEKSPALGDLDRDRAPAPTLLPVGGKSPSSELWTSLLIVLVIGTAVLLGVAIGWHGAARGGSSPAEAVRPAPSTVSASSNPSSEFEPPSALPPSDSTQPANASTAGQSVNLGVRIAAPASASPPVGGLVVTENGRVVYRSVPQGGAQGSVAGPGANLGTRLIHRVAPEYPPEAKERNIQGTVVLLVEIQADGTIGEVGIASGDPLLARAAVKAVRQWRYQPYSVQGQPAQRQTRISIKFSLAPS
jgi:TonB family protein